MEYGLTFVLDMYDVESGEEMHVLAMPGDYLRMSDWADANLAGAAGNEVARNLRRNYALAWHALKRRGKAEEMGLPDDLDIGGLDAMADRYTLFVNDFDGDAVPLAQAREG